MILGVFAQVGQAALTALQSQISQVGQTASNAQTMATAAASPGASVHADLYAKITALQNALATLTPGISVIALAEGATTAVLLNASADIVLPLSRNMADTNYTVELPRLGSAVFALKAKTTTSITVTMTAAGVSITAGQPLVAAVWK